MISNYDRQNEIRALYLIQAGAGVARAAVPLCFDATRPQQRYSAAVHARALDTLRAAQGMFLAASQEFSRSPRPAPPPASSRPQTRVSRSDSTPPPLRVEDLLPKSLGPECGMDDVA